MSSGGGGSERELQELIKKQSRDFAAHKKELDQLKRELAKANQSGGKPAAAGSSQQAADGGAKKKFWSCVGCSYKENFFSRQTCRECGLQKGSPAALPPGLGATPGVQTAAAAAAAEKAAAAKAAAAAAARAAEEAAKAAKHAKTVEPGGTEAVPGAMAVDGLLADRIASTEAYIRLLKGGKDSLGWERAKVQLEAAEEDLKALREEQRAARPVAARMQASAAKLARCREAATLVNLELIEAQAWVKVVSERQGEAEAQLLVAEAEDQALRAEAGADMVEIQVKGILETVAQELFKTGLPPELCQGVALAISQVYNQLAASGTLAGAGGGAAPAAVPASRGDSAAGRAEPAAAAAAAAACSTATGASFGPAAAAVAPRWPLRRAAAAPAAAARSGAPAVIAAPAAAAGPAAAGPAAASGAAAGSASTAAAAAEHSAAQAAYHEAMAASVAASAGVPGEGETDFKRQRVAEETRQQDIREHLRRNAVSSRGRAAAGRGAEVLQPGLVQPRPVLPGPTGMPSPQLPPRQTCLREHSFQHRGPTGMRVGSGLSSHSVNSSRSRSGRSLSDGSGDGA